MRSDSADNANGTVNLCASASSVPVQRGRVVPATPAACSKCQDNSQGAAEEESLNPAPRQVGVSSDTILDRLNSEEKQEERPHNTSTSETLKVDVGHDQCLDVAPEF